MADVVIGVNCNSLFSHQFLVMLDSIVNLALIIFPLPILITDRRISLRLKIANFSRNFVFHFAIIFSLLFSIFNLSLITVFTVALTITIRGLANILPYSLQIEHYDNHPAKITTTAHTTQVKHVKINFP
jgi:hypothetical protein